MLPKVDAVWLTSDPIVLANTDSIQTIFTQCELKKKSIFTYSSAFAEYGAVLMISADIPTIGRQAAELAKALLDNGEPTERLLLPAGSCIALNLKKITQYGIALNKDALDSVNEFIQ